MNQLTLALDERELAGLRSALNVMADKYREMEEREANDVDRASLTGLRTAALAMLTRLRSVSVGEGDVASVDFERGDFSVLERSIRMSAAKWQAMITPAMPEVQKALHRDGADEAGKLLSKVRRARGLPS